MATWAYGSHRLTALSLSGPKPYCWRNVRAGSNHQHDRDTGEQDQQRAPHRHRLGALDKAGKANTADCRWTAIWQKKGSNW
jgi:hypothetical protein